MHHRLCQNLFKEIKSEKGFALIETLVSLALLSILSVGFLSALSTTFVAATVSQGRTAAESLAKSQLEDIKAQDFIPTSHYGEPHTYELINIPADLVEKGYSLEINTPETVPDVGEPSELQKVTVVVKKNSEAILSISDYKTGRYETGGGHHH